MPNNKWSDLNHLQLRRFGEYFAKMEFTKLGFDVYSSEIDDKGIDFIVRENKDEYFDIQVKSVRNYNYTFMKKKHFHLSKNLLLALVLFENGKEPISLLVPSLDWENKPSSFLVGNDYNGKKSEPEWGVSITKSNLQGVILKYGFEKQIQNI
ncbi:MAG: DUF4365 domain-containing protein [Candidatus Woesearchaeota archaeon]